MAKVGTATVEVAKAAEADPDASSQSLQMVPHAGVVHLVENDAGEFQVSHDITLERRPLGLGRWSSVFDDDGYGVVCEDAPGAEPQHLEDILQRSS